MAENKDDPTSCVLVFHPPAEDAEADEWSQVGTLAVAEFAFHTHAPDFPDVVPDGLGGWSCPSIPGSYAVGMLACVQAPDPSSVRIWLDTTADPLSDGVHVDPVANTK